MKNDTDISGELAAELQRVWESFVGSTEMWLVAGGGGFLLLMLLWGLIGARRARRPENDGDRL